MMEVHVFLLIVYRILFSFMDFPFVIHQFTWQCGTLLDVECENFGDNE